ncbi:hypothetical protein I6F35_25430 [Bradyrhizobium sp. BRP22]|uniref:hypothetical protein n=1 Tax=Bradyrhizobium sp. BRP22 TaxID=2793821 RepID=UPI001CD53240|nr:hypothetical protein [Bradyrhizobium sp. BRP22]MCA1456515.1 hypothetical protein [Bradyrhizobium sp. BRP22]
MTAENALEEKTTSYSFRLGIKYRHPTGNFDSSGFCDHVVSDASDEIRSAAASLVKTAASMWHCRKTTSLPSIRIERIRI